VKIIPERHRQTDGQTTYCRITALCVASRGNNGKWGPKWLLNELASAIWPLSLIHVDANISDQLPKLYLFDSLNRTMCEGDMSPYSISGAKPQPPNVFLDIIGS